MKTQRLELQALFDLFFVGLGIWTIYCHLVVFSGGTFNTLVNGSSLPLALFVLVLAYQRRVRGAESRAADEVRFERLPEDPDLRAATDEPPLWLLWMAGAAAIVALYYLTGSFLLWWLASTAFVSFILVKAHESSGGPTALPTADDPAPTWLVVLLLGLLAFFAFTIFVPNPNWESTFYLSMGISSAEFPDRMLLRNDWLHGEPNLPPLAYHRLAQSWELLIATLSHFTGIDQKALFYDVFPRIVLAMSVVAHWLALRQFGISWRNAIFGIFLICLVWMSWGGHSGSLGTWTFAAITTGKGALVALGVPAVLYSAARYRDDANWINWLVFACTLISAVGLSSNGIVVAPLTAGFVLISGMQKTRAAFMRTAWGLLPIAYIALVSLAIVAVEAAATDANALGQVGDRIRDLQHTPHEGLRRVLGVATTAGPHPYLALFCLLALPTIPLGRPGQRRKLQALVLGILLLVLNPFAPVALSGLAANMWWRSFWSVPFPLLIGLAGSMLLSMRFDFRWVPMNYVGVALLALAFALNPHPWGVSKRNVKLPWQEYGLYYRDQSFEAARLITQQFSADDLLWVPERVAMWLIAFEGHPRLIAVRRKYLGRILGPLGREEVSARMELQKWMDIGRGVSDSSVAKARAAFLETAIHRFGISGVVLKEGNDLHRLFARVLREEGFSERPTAQGYSMWTAAASNNPSAASVDSIESTNRRRVTGRLPLH